MASTKKVKVCKFIKEHGRKLLDCTTLPYAHHSACGCTYVQGTDYSIPLNLHNEALLSFPSLDYQEEFYVLLNFAKNKDTGMYVGTVIGERGIHYFDEHALLTSFLHYEDTDKLKKFISLLQIDDFVMPDTNQLVCVDGQRFLTTDIRINEWMYNFITYIVDVNDCMDSLTWKMTLVTAMAHDFMYVNSQRIMDESAFVQGYGSTSSISGKARETLYKYNVLEQTELFISSTGVQSKHLVIAHSGIFLFVNKKRSHFFTYYNFIKDTDARKEFAALIDNIFSSTIRNWLDDFLSNLTDQVFSLMLMRGLPGGNLDNIDTNSIFKDKSIVDNFKNIEKDEKSFTKRISVFYNKSSRSTFNIDSGKGSKRKPGEADKDGGSFNSLSNIHSTLDTCYPDVAGHLWSIKSYKQPTFCNFCNSLLVGYKNGYKCTLCKMDVHKRCLTNMEGFICRYDLIEQVDYERNT